ncbi:MAG: type II secretion system F family protein [Nitrososphaeria archaeon]
MAKVKGQVKGKRVFRPKVTFTGLSYAYFGWFGRRMLKFFKHIPATMEAANIRIHPETYLSMCGFAFFVSLIIFVPLALIGFFLVNYLMLTLLAVPPIVLVLFLVYPNLAATSRASVLDTEVPFAAAYVSVLASGGISPYKAFERLKDLDFLPQLGTAAKLIYVDTRARGIDPVTALEESSKHVPSKDYQDFVLGYASTLRVGGDTEHYLLKRTELMFDSRKTKIKIIGERMALLMESYITVAILLALALYIMFIVSKIMPTSIAGVSGGGGGLFTTEAFVLFSYIFLPVISGVFLYLVDVTAPKYPISDYRAYKWFFATLPFSILLAMPMVVAFYIPTPLVTAGDFRPLEPFYYFIQDLRKIMNLDPGFEPALGISVVMLITFLPGMIMDTKYSRENALIGAGITNFLRDLVEIRKTGISPEKCISYLAKREYGEFSKILKTMANEISWGISFRRILSDLRRRLHGWLNLMTMFLLIDSIDVGGGTPETLESLATFSESIMAIEKEKKSSLRPLLLLPYIGGIIMLLSVITILYFARSVYSAYAASFGFGEFVKIFVPPVIFNVVFMGLVAGKVSGERVSAGFKHSFILALVSLISLYIAPMFLGSFQIVST